jgi:hypothetical protein
MRTKTLICAAALVAAGAFSAMAQSNVYSLNVVGYVNVPTVGGGNFNLMANPLVNANNGITNLFTAPTAQDGDQIYRWNVGAQDLDGTIYTYATFSSSWDGNFSLLPGEAVFYLNAGGNKTNTFVGDVGQGVLNQPSALGSGGVDIIGGGSFNMIGGPVPISGAHTNATDGIIPRDGDQVYTWNTGAQDLNGTIATYSTFSSSWDTLITITPGQGFFYLGAGPNQAAWTRNFTVPQ